MADGSDIRESVDFPWRSTCSAHPFGLFPSSINHWVIHPPSCTSGEVGPLPFLPLCIWGMWHATGLVHIYRNRPPKDHMAPHWCTEQCFWELCTQRAGGGLLSGALKHGCNNVMMGADTLSLPINCHFQYLLKNPHNLLHNTLWKWIFVWYWYLIDIITT